MRVRMRRLRLRVRRRRVRVCFGVAPGMRVWGRRRGRWVMRMLRVRGMLVVALLTSHVKLSRSSRSERGQSEGNEEQVGSETHGFGGAEGRGGDESINGEMDCSLKSISNSPVSPGVDERSAEKEQTSAQARRDHAKVARVADEDARGPAGHGRQAAEQQGLRPPLKPAQERQEL